MSGILFDEGDRQRLERESQLTAEAPRQLPQEDRSPDQDVSILAEQKDDEPDFDMMLEGLIIALRENLQ